MLVTLSESRFTARVRELSNIPSNISDEEINHRLDRHAAKLFSHLAAYGFTGFDRVAIQGTLGTFRATLSPCYDDESRNTRIAGLAFLDPVSVTLEARDLPAFYVGLLLTLMNDNFDEYASEFQRLTVSELDSKLVDVATKVFTAPQPVPFVAENEDDEALLREYQEEEFANFCRRSGVKVPDSHSRAVDEFNEAEIQREEARRQSAVDRFRRGEE
jgi:hypothetical protein